jgi:cellulose synthase/poly-beta-1,6-N-acetylglucosamine synthase-like glycosyltransferase
MKQNYYNYRIVILDDSTNAESLKAVDAFAKEHKLAVVRRATRKGHKAGNLNNYLRSSSADFFVVLDSDEIVPPDFITKALPYFTDPHIAIVQAHHKATNNQNTFMDWYADGVESHWYTYQNIKEDFGFLSFLGHGAMVSMKAYREVGGFPEMVAEDLCFSIELRNKGYFVAFADDILCFEQYPINYLAFKKRHSKWTQGNMEFIRAYTLKIITSPMHWYEKLDLFLFTYSLPLSVVFSLYLVINIIIFPLLKFDPHYPPDMLIPTVLFLLAPILNDLIFYSMKRNPFKMFGYAFCLILLYGSLFYISFKSSFLALFRTAQFVVTPKTSEYISVLNAVIFNRGEIVFSCILMSISFGLMHSILPVVLIAVPSFASVYLTRLSNKTIEIGKEKMTI